VTTAARYLWANPNPSAAVRARPMQNPVDAAVLWSIALLAIFAPLAARLYQHCTSN
jgi:ABC-2 type transport system permease protein